MIAALIAAVLALMPTHHVTGYLATCRGCTGITASGARPLVGRTAACDTSIRFGTRVWIEDIGWRVCEDRGPDIVGRAIDVLVADSTAAFQITGSRRALFTMQ